MSQLHREQAYLDAIPPFDFAQSLNFLGIFAPTQSEQTLTAQLLTKAVMIDGQPIGFQLRSVGTATAPKLECQLFSEKVISSTKAKALDRIACFLSLADDLRPFYQTGQKDPYFAPVLNQLYGYHQVKFLTPFESACWAVLTQRTPIAIARKIKQVLVKFGGFVSIDGTSYPAFPEPGKLAALPKNELAALMKSERKAEYISEIAEAFSQVDEHFLRTGYYSEVESWLRKIKGIGAWSAAFILLRGLGRMESTPLSEKKLLEIISKLYGQAQTMTPAAVQGIAENYGQWQGYWAHYLRISG